MPGEPDQPLLLLDACVVINLYASSRIVDILSAFPGRIGIVDIVYQEALYLRSSSSTDDADEREMVDLSSLVDLGVIQILTAIDENELELFVDLSLELDDGEALTAALAMNRGCLIATDDKAAIRIINDRILVLSTLDLISRWQNHCDVPTDVIRAILIRVRERGSYMPGRNHRLYWWWTKIISGK